MPRSSGSWSWTTAPNPCTRVTAKLADYQQLATSTRIATPILLWTTTARREARIRQAMAQTLHNLDRPELVPVATTAADLTPPDQHLDPTPARWLPLTASRPGRLGLHQLPDVPPHLRPTARRDDTAGPSDPSGRLHPPHPMPPPASLHPAA